MRRPTAADHHLAQLNVARLRFRLDDPRARTFLRALEPVNLLAEQSPGFVWRHASGDGHVTLDEGGLVVVNLSLWACYADLHAFVYRSAHGGFLRRRGEWFEPMKGVPATVLWWVPAGTEPTIEQARARLRHVTRYGPTPGAFTLRQQFDAAGRRVRRSTGPAA